MGLGEFLGGWGERTAHASLSLIFALDGIPVVINTSTGIPAKEKEACGGWVG